MPSLSPPVSNRMPDFNATPDSNVNDGNPRFRNRRGGGFSNNQNRGFPRNNNSQRNTAAGPSPAESKSVPPASAFMGRSQLGRQSAEEHLKQMTPELRQWVSELAPVLEMYDYDARDIADLVKQCQFDPVKIQTAVDGVFEEKRGHELGEWQVSRGKRRHSNPRKEDLPSTPPSDNFRQQQQRGRHFNNNNKPQFTQPNNRAMANGTFVPNGGPSSNDAVGGREASPGDQNENDGPKGRRQFNQPSNNNQQRRRSMNHGPRGRPKGSRLRGDSRDYSTQRKEQDHSTPSETVNDVDVPEKPSCDSPAPKASPPNSWARIAAGAVDKRRAAAATGTSPTTQETSAQQSSSQVTTEEDASIREEAEAIEAVEQHEVEESKVSVSDDAERFDETNEFDNEEEVDENETATTTEEGQETVPTVNESQPSPSIKASPLQQPQISEQPNSSYRSPSVSPHPSSIHDPTPSSPLPSHQPSPSIGETDVPDGHSTSLNDPNSTDDVVLPPPVGRDVVLPRHIAGTPSRFGDRAGFVFGTLQRGAQRVDVRFGVPTPSDDLLHQPLQSPNEGPPGLAESPRTAATTAAARVSSKPVELQAEQQKIETYPEDPAIIELKAPSATKPRTADYIATTNATTMANQPSQVLHQPAHQEQPQQPQQPHLMYDAYGTQQPQQPAHQPQRLQDFGGMEDQQQGHPRRHYNNNVMYQNQNQSVQGGPGSLKSQRPNANRMNYGHRNNSSGLGGYHQSHHQQHHHQNFAPHDDYLDRIPQQQPYQQQYHNQRGIVNRGGYTSFRQQDYNPVPFSSDFTGQDTTTMSQTATATNMAPPQQAQYANAYSTNYSYGMGYGDSQQTPHLHDATQQGTNEYPSYHHQQQQHRGYNQMSYRPYGQQLSGGYTHHQLDLQQPHKAQQQYGQQQQQQPSNTRFGGSTDATNGSVDSRQSQQQQQTQAASQQQPQQQDVPSSTQQPASTSSATTSQTHPSATAQPSQMWRQPTPTNSSYALYDPQQSRQQATFSTSATAYDQPQQQPQTFDHSSTSLRYSGHQQPVIPNTTTTTATAATNHHHPHMMMMDSTNASASTTGAHRGYSATNPSGNYGHHAAPNYLYDTSSATTTSAGVPMEYAASSGLLQQHTAAAVAAQSHLSSFAASHQGQRGSTALDQGYSSGMYGNYGATQQYPAQSTRHL